MRKLIIKKSDLSGFGLFAGEQINKGEIILIFCMNCFLISEKDYNEEQKKGNELLIKTGCRYVDGIFLYTDDGPRYENYINHSFDPNIVYHAGICFAKKNISIDEELTIDYTYLLAENDYCSFIDKKTGKKVDGINSILCLKETSKQLLEIYSDDNLNKDIFDNIL